MKKILTDRKNLHKLLWWVQFPNFNECMYNTSYITKNPLTYEICTAFQVQKVFKSKRLYWYAYTVWKFSFTVNNCMA